MHNSINVYLKFTNNVFVVETKGHKRPYQDCLKCIEVFWSWQCEKNKKTKNKTKQKTNQQQYVYILESYLLIFIYDESFRLRVMTLRTTMQHLIRSLMWLWW